MSPLALCSQGNLRWVFSALCPHMSLRGVLSGTVQVEMLLNRAMRANGEEDKQLRGLVATAQSAIWRSLEIPPLNVRHAGGSCREREVSARGCSPAARREDRQVSLLSAATERGEIIQVSPL